MTSFTSNPYFCSRIHSHWLCNQFFHPYQSLETLFFGLIRISTDFLTHFLKLASRFFSSHHSLSFLGPRATILNKYSASPQFLYLLLLDPCADPQLLIYCPCPRLARATYGFAACSAQTVPYMRLFRQGGERSAVCQALSAAFNWKEGLIGLMYT